MTDYYEHLVWNLQALRDDRSVLVGDAAGPTSVDLDGIGCDVEGLVIEDSLVIRVHFRPHHDELVGSLGVILPVRGLTAWHWSRGWRPLGDVYVPLGRSSAVRTGDGLVLELLGARSVRQTVRGLEVRCVDGQLAAGTSFVDRPVVVGFRERLGTVETIGIRCYRAAFPRWQLWPVPAPVQAALALTDHADFDTVGGLQALARDPLLRNRIRVTKSVFVTNPLDSFPAALSSREALAAVRQLADAGNEIAVHSTRPSGAGAPGVASDLSVIGVPVRTWIDHGPVSRTNASRNGLAEGSTDDVRPHLRDCGIRNVWAYLDRASNPTRLAAPERLQSRARHLRERFAQVRGVAGWHQAAFLVADALGGPGPGGLRSSLSGIKRTVTRRPIAPGGEPDPQHRYAGRPERRDVVKVPTGAYLAATLFPRAILPDWRPWFFCSVRVNDLAGCLSPEALAQFVGDGGAEILHTYLLSNHALAGWTGEWKTSRARQGLLQLAESGPDLWVGPVDEWAEHLRAQESLEFGVDAAHGEWRVCGPSDHVTTLVAVGDGSRRPSVRAVALRSR